MRKNKNYFGRLNKDGNVIVLNMDGSIASRVNVEGLYPVDSDFSVKYEHPEGIILSLADARILGLTNDDDVLF